ncbi:DEAD/DEAH box helicase [Gordonia sp. SL306]|uniref:DEAD/DEAH box helicase n=1 Tax=Gordonia sp. SL306 TaxID=2995145 RepID=UPI00227081F3|nr:DEAD/DEAH box helicase [Gordonia sp. SL306]WAC55741.1 DEAD/DEAH box helicase [Gordonia sp. SL306]
MYDVVTPYTVQGSRLRRQRGRILPTQATYLPDVHLFAVWSSHATNDPERHHQVRLAVPADDGPGLVATPVRCDLIEPTALGDLPPGHSRSVDAWQSIARGSERALPVAAHAVADPTGTALTSAAHARAAFRTAQALPEPVAAGLRADLRPYQARGIAWLDETVTRVGGAVLADEMGLGKTVQAIGLLLSRAALGPQVVVCPKSLISNWLREIRRFAPSLLASSASGADATLRATQVVVMSYPQLRAGYRGLTETPWSTAVFDEAQALKNTRTQLTRAARALSAAAKVALTGTPVENDLDELWSILHVVAPRIFPHRAVFRRRFSRAVADGDAGALDRLRVATRPAMLARSKNQVAVALPPKIVVPVLCDLTDEQARIYDECLDAVVDNGFGSGIERHGRVLATLTRLKQICNHPGLVTGDLHELSGRSGKLDACTEVIRSNLDTNSPTLVFTQYRATGELLRRHFADEVRIDAPFFHGGLTDSQRHGMVSDFQAGLSGPVMILSLKAGGVGLNLTRACDVVHFDRWWNPAVESQASDRVHRIGQDRPVTVTTLTTATTLEEHIASMHDRKAALGAHADDTSMIADLARLSDERLFDVLRRSRES